jgi:hypothetical protein
MKRQLIAKQKQLFHNQTAVLLMKNADKKGHQLLVFCSEAFTVAINRTVQ